MELVSGAFRPQALRNIIELDIPDILDTEQSKTVDEIAHQIDINSPTPTNVNKDAILRTMRLLTTVGIIEEGRQSTANTFLGDNQQQQQQPFAFRLTKTGALLQKKTTTTTTRKSYGQKQEQPQEPNIQSCVQHWTEKPLWNSWLELPKYIRGEDQMIIQNDKESKDNLQSSASLSSLLPFDRANNGVSSDQFYDRKEHPQSLQYANEFVHFISNQEIRTILRYIDWSDYNNDWSDYNNDDSNDINPFPRKKTIVDIGGNQGQVMKAIIQNYPNLQFNYKVFDLPDVIASIRNSSSTNTGSNATSVLTATPIEFISGNILEKKTLPPCCCDVILMEHFLDQCMFDEEESIKILKHCHSILRPMRGQIILAEAVLPDNANHDNLNNTVTGTTTSSSAAMIMNQLQLSMDALYMLVGRERQRTESEWMALATRAGFLQQNVRFVRTTASPSCSIILLTK